MDGSLRGKLLIASPQLADYFRRTVVLVVEHNEEGALGVVLNRPTDTEVADAVPALAELAPQDEVLHAGGPVQPEAVLVLADFEDPADAATPVAGSIGLLDPDRTEVGVRSARVFAGYAGWAPGQLDGEIEQDAWIVEEVAPGDPFTSDDLWIQVLQRKGGSFALMATMPVDPSLN